MLNNAGRSPRHFPGRESMKDARKSERQTLAEVCAARLKNLEEAKRKLALKKNSEKYAEAEREMMVLMYGPNWEKLDLGDGYDTSKKDVDLEAEED